jgi:hypothetical protein
MKMLLLAATIYLNTQTGEWSPAPFVGYNVVTNAPPAAVVPGALPEQLENGVETPVLILRTANPEKGVGIVADPQTLDLVVYLDHESPRDPALIAARIAAERDKRNQLRLDLKAIRVNCATNILEVQAIDPTDSSAAAQKSQIQALKRELVDTQRELQNLRAIVRDLIKGTD